MEVKSLNQTAESGKCTVQLNAKDAQVQAELSAHHIPLEDARDGFFFHLTTRPEQGDEFDRFNDLNERENRGLHTFFAKEDPVGKQIFDVVLTLKERGDKFDWISVAEELTKRENKPGADRLLDAAARQIETQIETRWQDCLKTLNDHENSDQSKAFRNPFKLLTLDEICSRPRPDWLVDEMLLEIGTSAMSGDYGSFKSFVALDIGLCIATGREWQGREVKAGAVVYVVAEGAYTTQDRAKAWCICHQLGLPKNFRVIEVPAQIADPTICAQFIEAIEALNPIFVVLDTLAKCNVGADENSSRDMGLFTDGMQKIGTKLGAQVLTVHHNNKSGTARGSNSLPSNVDTHITLKASAGNVVTLSCEKTKTKPFERFSLVGREVEIGEQDKRGREITSLIFEPTDRPATASKSLSANDKTCLEVLPTSGATSAEWQNLADAKGIARSTFYYCRDALANEKQEVEKIGEIYQRIVEEK
jgi:hypothetical protein